MQRLGAMHRCPGGSSLRCRRSIRRRRSGDTRCSCHARRIRLRGCRRYRSAAAKRRRGSCRYRSAAAKRRRGATSRWLRCMRHELICAHAGHQERARARSTRLLNRCRRRRTIARLAQRLRCRVRRLAARTGRRDVADNCLFGISHWACSVGRGDISDEQCCAPRVGIRALDRLVGIRGGLKHAARGLCRTRVGARLPLRLCLCARERAARRRPCARARRPGRQRLRAFALSSSGLTRVGWVRVRIVGCIVRRSAVGHDGVRECSSFGPALRVRDRSGARVGRQVLPASDVLHPPA
jgi:hypothetical protein